MKRSIGKLPIILAVLVALSVGLVGTATLNPANAINKKSTIKLIKKYVKKGTAKKAKTANNAKKLGGKRPSAYTEKAFLFHASVDELTNNVDIVLPLQAGKYLVTWTAILDNLSPGLNGCYLSVNGDAWPSGDSVTESVNQPIAGHSGSGVIDIQAGNPAALRCFADSSFTTAAPINIGAMPLDSTTRTALTATPGSVRPTPGPASRYGR